MFTCSVWQQQIILWFPCTSCKYFTIWLTLFWQVLKSRKSKELIEFHNVFVRFMSFQQKGKTCADKARFLSPSARQWSRTRNSYEFNIADSNVPTSTDYQRLPFLLLKKIMDWWNITVKMNNSQCYQYTDLFVLRFVESTNIFLHFFTELKPVSHHDAIDIADPRGMHDVCHIYEFCNCLVHHRVYGSVVA